MAQAPAATTAFGDVEAGAAHQPLLGATDGGAAGNGQDWVRGFATSTYAWLSHTATCILLGLLCSVALKLFGPPLATAAVILSLLVLVLAYYGYVNLNWGTVTSAFKWGLDADRDGRVGLSDFKIIAARIYSFVVGFGLSALGGFLLGFWLGLKLL